MFNLPVWETLVRISEFVPATLHQLISSVMKAIQYCLFNCLRLTSFLILLPYELQENFGLLHPK